MVLSGLPRTGRGGGGGDARSPGGGEIGVPVVLEG